MARTKHYSPSTKMAELISDHYSMLLLILRFEIPLGMGEKTISEVCEENNLDLETFLFIVHFILFREGKGQSNLSDRLSLPLIIKFLKNSHKYFLEHRLPSIREKLVEATEEAPEEIKFVINRYYHQYEQEVHQHMEYENNVVFPYVEQLLAGHKKPNYNISTFEQRHDQVEMKMMELKNIFIKYYNVGTAEFKLNNVLHELFSCGEELRDHNAVEDDIFIPAVLEIEQRLLQANN